MQNPFEGIFQEFGGPDPLSAPAPAPAGGGGGFSDLLGALGLGGAPAPGPQMAQAPLPPTDPNAYARGADTGGGIRSMLDTFLGTPSKTQAELANKSRMQQHSLAAERQTNLAYIDTMKEIERLRRENPGMPQHELQGALFRSPTFQKAALRLSPDKMQKFVQDTVQSLSRPPVKPFNAPAGATTYFMDPETGRPAGGTMPLTTPTTETQNRQALARMPQQEFETLQARTQGLGRAQREPQGTQMERALRARIEAGEITQQQANQFLTERAVPDRDPTTGELKGMYFYGPGGETRRVPMDPTQPISAVPPGQRPLPPEQVQGGLGPVPSGTYPAQRGANAQPSATAEGQIRAGVDATPPPTPIQRIPRLSEDPATLPPHPAYGRPLTRADMVDAVGAVPGLTKIISGITGQISPRYDNPELNDAVANLGALRQTIQQAKAQGRELKAEVEALERTIPQMSATSNPAEAAAIGLRWAESAEAWERRAQANLGDRTLPNAVRTKEGERLVISRILKEFFGPSQQWRDKIDALSSGRERPRFGVEALGRAVPAVGDAMAEGQRAFEEVRGKKGEGPSPEAQKGLQRLSDDDLKALAGRVRQGDPEFPAVLEEVRRRRGPARVGGRVDTLEPTLQGIIPIGKDTPIGQRESTQVEDRRTGVGRWAEPQLIKPSVEGEMIAPPETFGLSNPARSFRDLIEAEADKGRRQLTPAEDDALRGKLGDDLYNAIFGRQ